MPEADLPTNLAEDLALLAEAARAAGTIARRFWRQGPRSWEKPDGAGPVSEADLAINDMLAARLRAARPAYGWLSEESPDDPARLSAGRVFILDPLDGTRAFLAGEEIFAHSLAVAEEGKIVAGAVYLPVRDLLFTALAGGPARCNGQPIRASAQAEPEGATLLTARRNLDPGNWAGGQVPPVRRAFRSSLAYRLCLVAEGRFDAMLSLGPVWEWDIAAGDLIARAAGATVSDRAAAPLCFNRPDPRSDGVLAGPARLHAALAGALVPPFVLPGSA